MYHILIVDLSTQRFDSPIQNGSHEEEIYLKSKLYLVTTNQLLFYIDNYSIYLSE